MMWDHGKYFAKAQSYWAMATSLERDSEQFFLQVSFFCEFFIRGCLTEHSPVLNSENEEESILYAAGISPNKPPASVKMSLAIKRILRLIPEITETEIKAVTALINARNVELHSDVSEISGITNSEILPSIFSLVVRLAKFSNQDLDVIMGKEDASQASSIAGAISKDRKKRVRDLIKIQKDRFFSLPKEEQKKQRTKSIPSFRSAVMKSGHHVMHQKCPACAELGLFAGSPVGRSAPFLREDEIFEEVRIQPEIFNCKCCELIIKGLDELMAAGFPHEFVTLADVDLIEYFNIDPMEHVDTDEIIRQYNEDMYFEQFD